MINKHLVLTLLGYTAFGFGVAVQEFGIKAGLGLYPTIIIFTSCTLFYLWVILVPMEKVKAMIKKSEANEIKEEPKP